MSEKLASAARAFAAAPQFDRLQGPAALALQKFYRAAPIASELTESGEPPHPLYVRPVLHLPRKQAPVRFSFDLLEEAS